MGKTTPSQDLRRRKLEEDPTCSRCGVTKTIDDFPPRAVDYWCIDCRRDYAAELYRHKRDSMTDEERRKWREQVNRKQRENRRKRLARMSESERAEFQQEVNAGNKRRRHEVRDEVYQAYGGYRCACCGETEPMFLSIDHVNNDGAEHKRRDNLVTGEQLYRWLKRNGFPEGFQVLCMNCQWGKRNNNGVCPHQVRCNDYPERE